MVNYIPDLNPFGLAPPPPFFLAEMLTFDDQLVVMPSRQEALFRLTRRSLRAPKLGTDDRMPHPLLKALPSPDTIMMASHGVVPVSTLLHWGVWAWGAVEKELRARDIWAAGGPEKAADLLDAKDQARRDAADAENRADLEARIDDAWIALQYRAGNRFSMTPANSKGVDERFRLKVNDRRPDFMQKAAKELLTPKPS